MKTKILMVCLGNICRSPLAEGILQSKVDSDKFFIDSAGTGGYHIGNPPDPRSIAVAEKHGLDISKQRCRKLQSSDLHDFDIVYVMDKANYRDVIALAKNDAEREKIKLILKEVNISEQQVPDPYHDEEDGFEHVYQLLDTACEAIAKKL